MATDASPLLLYNPVQKRAPASASVSASAPAASPLAVTSAKTAAVVTYDVITLFKRTVTFDAIPDDGVCRPHQTHECLTTEHSIAYNVSTKLITKGCVASMQLTGYPRDASCPVKFRLVLVRSNSGGEGGAEEEARTVVRSNWSVAGVLDMAAQPPSFLATFSRGRADEFLHDVLGGPRRWINFSRLDAARTGSEIVFVEVAFDGKAAGDDTVVAVVLRGALRLLVTKLNVCTTQRLAHGILDVGLRL